MESIYIGNMSGGQFVGQEHLGPLMADLTPWFILGFAATAATFGLAVRFLPKSPAFSRPVHSPSPHTVQSSGQPTAPSVPLQQPSPQDCPQSPGQEQLSSEPVQ